MTTAVRLRYRLIQSAALTVMAVAQPLGTPLVLTTLQSQDAMTAGRGDQRPVPRGPERPHAGFVASSPLTLLDTGTAATYLFRTPYRVTVPPPPRRVWDDPPNLLLTTLAQAPAAEFGPGRNNADDQPVPRGRRPLPFDVVNDAYALRNAPAEPTLARPRAVVAVPYAALLRRHHVSLLTWTQSPFPPPAAAPPEDFGPGRPNADNQPVPRGVRAHPAVYEGSVSSSRLLLPAPVVDSTTVYRTAYTVPRPAVRRALLDAPPNLLLTTLAQAPAAAPFAPIDWPVPTSKRAPVALRTWAQNLLLTTLATEEIQLGGSDWENPIPRRFPFAALLAPAPNLLLTTLAAPAAAPGVPIEWPVPTRPAAPVALRTHVSGALVLSTLQSQDTFFGGAGKAPVYDWPVPTGKAYPVSLRTWTFTLPLDVLSQQPVFFGAPGQSQTYDWPNPRGKVYPIGLRTWTQNLLLTTLAGKDQFFGPPGYAPDYHWPNPIAKPYPVALRTGIFSFPIDVLSQQPVFFGAPGQTQTYDWPLPRGKAFPVALRTWVQAPVPPAAVPFVPIDWAMPRARAAAPALRTWTHNAAIHLIGRDVFFGPAGKAPVYDWPNPLGRPPLRIAPMDQRSLALLTGPPPPDPLPIIITIGADDAVILIAADDDIIVIAAADDTIIIPRD